MIFKRPFRNWENRKRFAHVTAAFVIIIHAYEKYETGQSSYKLFGIAGLIFLIVALLHPIIEKKAPWVDGVFFIIEGILSIIMAVDFFHLGKKALPCAYLFLAIFQFFIAFKKSKNRIKNHNRELKSTFEK